ncbi:MAG: cobalt-precorrin-5B (C(1))-methyltransferase CbiD [Nitrospinota bacterium]
MEQKRTLKKGYTTGACAAASAKAALVSLVQGSPPDGVSVSLPGGKKVFFKVFRSSLEGGISSCSVIKDAGDDPDVTNGAEIGCEVSFQEKTSTGENNPIIISGGEGVGLVTKPGLPVPVGSPAINPVPFKMILGALREALATFKESPFSAGVTIEARIIVPRGKILAKKTLNPRLGIVGGISILGTTGIVEPMSLKAYEATIDSALDVLIAGGKREVALTPGRNSEKLVEKLLALPKEAFVVMGDHVGYALKACVRRGIVRITIAGRLGKLSKIGFGHFETHAYDVGVDFPKMAEWAREGGASEPLCTSIRAANTMAMVVDLITTEKCLGVFSKVASGVVARAEEFIQNQAEVTCILFNSKGEVIAKEG